MHQLLHVLFKFSRVSGDGLDNVVVGYKVEQRLDEDSANVLQCCAVCCSAVQCGAVWCSVVQGGAVWCSVVQRGSVCCSVPQ